MISCIVCSRSADISTTLKENLSVTIGCEYELVVVDNSNNNYTIFSAYNEGVRRAKGDVLCFMHEDIYYYTQNWGTIVNNYFINDSSLGLLGILGSHYLAKCVCGVGDSSLLSGYYYVKTDLFDKSEYFNSKGTAEVVVVDGMWFCMRKSIFFSQVKFDETYLGFHYYDMDICMQVLKEGYSCQVTNKVLLSHESLGVIDSVFLRNSFRFYEKWKEYLPIVRGYDFSSQELRLSSELSSMSAYARELDYYCRKYRNVWWIKLKKKLKSLLYR